MPPISLKKGQRFVLLAVALLSLEVALAEDAFSQDGAKPALVHKYSDPFCEFGRSAIDLFLIDLAKSRDKKGVIVLHPSLAYAFWPYMEKKTIQNHLRFRGFDESRIEILLGEPDLRPSTELWGVPTGKTHSLESRPWDYSVVDLYAPLLVYRRTESDAIEYGNCGESGFNHQFFAELLKRNDRIVGRIVVRAATTSRFEQAKRRIFRELIGKFKVGQKRLEFAFVKDKNDDVEYWILPSGYLEQF